MEIERLNKIVLNNAREKMKSAAISEEDELDGIRGRAGARSASPMTRDIQSARKPYLTELVPKDPTPRKKRSERTYNKDNINSSFLKEIFMNTIQEFVRIPKDSLYDLVDKLVSLVSTTLDSKVKEVEITEKKLERLKNYYSMRIKSQAGLEVPKAFDDLVYEFYGILKSYKEKIASGTLAHSPSPLRSTSVDNSAPATARGRLENTKNLTPYEKIKLMEEILASTSINKILDTFESKRPTNYRAKSELFIPPKRDRVQEPFRSDSEPEFEPEQNFSSFENKRPTAPLTSLNFSDNLKSNRTPITGPSSIPSFFEPAENGSQSARQNSKPPKHRLKIPNKKSQPSSGNVLQFSYESAGSLGPREDTNPRNESGEVMARGGRRYRKAEVLETQNTVGTNEDEK